MPRRIIILTDGFTDPRRAKTAVCLRSSVVTENGEQGASAMRHMEKGKAPFKAAIDAQLK